MAVVFDGSNYIEIADSASLRTPTTAITIACWIKPSATDGDPLGGIVYKRIADSDPWISYSLMSATAYSRKYHMGISAGSSTTYRDVGTATTVLKERWHFLVARWQSGGAMNVRVYDTNGNLATEVISANHTLTLGYNSEPMNFGRGLFSGTPAFWQGGLAGVYIHNARLSDTQLDDLLSDTIAVTAGGEGSPSIAPSAGYWPLASDADDASGNDNHGTPTGDPVFTEARDLTDWSDSAQDTTLSAESQGPVRELNGTTDNLVTAAGANGLASMTYGTIALLVKRTGAYNETWMELGAVGVDSGNSPLWDLYIDANGDRVSAYNGTASATTNIGLPLNRWCLLVWRKTSGTNQWRASMYDYGDDSWAHTNSITSLGNFTSSIGSGGTIQFKWPSGGDNTFNGRIAARAMWANEVKWSADAAGDSAIESAGLEETMQAWVDAEPTALWAFNQENITDEVDDILGDANQTSRTGTTVIATDAPSGFSFDFTLPSSDFEGWGVQMF